MLFVVAGRSLPGLPDVRLVAECRLFAVADDGLLQDLLVFEDLLELLVGDQIFDERQGLLVLAVLVDHGVLAADHTGDGLELPFGHAFLAEVHELELDAPLLKIPLGFPGVGGLLRAEDLDVHEFDLPFQAAMPRRRSFMVTSWKFSAFRSSWISASYLDRPTSRSART